MTEEMIQIKLEDAELKEFERRLGATARALPKVVSRGINRTAQQGRTLIGRRLREHIKIRAGDVAKRIYISPKATYQSLVARINISGRTIPLKAFGIRQTAKGVTWAAPLAMGLRSLVPHAFMLYEKVAIRAPKGWNPESEGWTIRAGAIFESIKLVPRLPFIWVRGPSLGEAYFNIGGLAAACEKEVCEKLVPNVNDQIDLILSGKRT